MSKQIWGGDRESVFISANTGSLESLGREILILVRDYIHTGREVVNTGLLTAQIEDTDLGVGNTTVEARLGVRLETRKRMLVNRSLPGHDEFHLLR